MTRKPLTAGTLSRPRDLRDMGATWPKIVELTGIPRVVLLEALHAAIWPPLVTRVELAAVLALIEAVREDIGS